MTDTLTRFWSKVDKAGDCWLWTAHSLPSGYGIFRLYGRDGARAYAHRFAYETMIGPIPAGRVLDHLCRNRSCVNPDHLEPVTQRENIHRGEPANRAHCPAGHPYNARNTYRNPGTTHRHCRACHRLRMANARRVDAHTDDGR